MLALPGKQDVNLERSASLQTSSQQQLESQWFVIKSHAHKVSDMRFLEESAVASPAGCAETIRKSRTTRSHLMLKTRKLNIIVCSTLIPLILQQTEAWMPSVGRLSNMQHCMQPPGSMRACALIYNTLFVNSLDVERAPPCMALQRLQHCDNRGGHK
jgi:hypothetical protein